MYIRCIYWTFESTSDQDAETLKEGTKNQEPGNTSTVGSQSIVSRRLGVEEARLAMELLGGDN